MAAWCAADLDTGRLRADTESKERVPVKYGVVDVNACACEPRHTTVSS